jgi:Tfp pilus assembly protein PilN
MIPGAHKSAGIDASGELFFVVETERSFFKTRILSSRSLPAGQDSGQASQSVRAAIPTADALLRRLEAPLRSRTKAQSVFASLLDVQLPFPLDDCFFQFPLISKTPAGMHTALAAVTLKDRALTTLSTLENAGLNVSAMDHEAVALWWLSIREQPPASGEKRIVVYLGGDRTSAAAGSDGELLAAAGLRLGEKSGDAGIIAGRLNQFIEALGWTAGEPLWRWCGPSSGSHWLKEMQTGTGAGALSRLHGEPDFFLARALALRELQPRKLPCNFRTGSFVHPHDAVRMKERERNALLRVAALAALLMAGSYGAGLRMETVRQQLNDQLASVAAAVSGQTLIPRGQEALTARRAMESMDDLAAAVANIEHSTLLSDLAGTVQKLLPAGITLETIDLDSNSLKLSGVTRAPGAVESLVSDLRNAGWICETQLDPAAEQQSYVFAIRGSR